MAAQKSRREKSRRGEVITFYSYKGGTGRTAALANMAWLLACRGKTVCAVDWDLEAPGLHRYFHPFLVDNSMSATHGLIDYLWKIADSTLGGSEDSAEEIDILDYCVRVDCEYLPDGAVLDIVSAGQQDHAYSRRATTFPWEAFYDRMGGGRWLEKTKASLVETYDYVLLDSRTGVSDTAGICTVQLPDRLVACYTLNRQSIEGVAAVLASIRQQAKDLPIFPIECRVEINEKVKLDSARTVSRPRFDNYLDRPARDYWRDMEILYWPYYAFEECPAIFGDDSRSRSQSSMLASMERISEHVTGVGMSEPFDIPAEARAQVLQEYALSPSNEDPDQGRALKAFVREVESNYQRWLRTDRTADLLGDKLITQLEIVELPGRLTNEPEFARFVELSRRMHRRRLLPMRVAAGLAPVFVAASIAAIVLDASRLLVFASLLIPLSAATAGFYFGTRSEEPANGRSLRP